MPTPRYSTSSSATAITTTTTSFSNYHYRVVAGVLNKWVNCGKRWRKRLFVLQDGILSYYKIHAPTFMELIDRLESSSSNTKLIGTITHQNHHQHLKNEVQSQLLPNPAGQVHLKIATIQNSKSSSKRFSVFTGTKRIQLRAENREDRTEWTQAFQAMKRDMIPKLQPAEFIISNSNNCARVSTDKLRHRLMEEGVNEAAIQDSEQIMRTEFSALYNQLLLIIEALNNLEQSISLIRKQQQQQQRDLVSNASRKKNSTRDFAHSDKT